MSAKGMDLPCVVAIRPGLSLVISGHGQGSRGGITGCRDATKNTSSNFNRLVFKRLMDIAFRQELKAPAQVKDLPISALERP
jgi:hypothetical protein